MTSSREVIRTSRLLVETEPIDTSRTRLRYEAKIKLVGQNHDPCSSMTLFGLPDHLGRATGKLAYG
jgi:hypothetical protein